MWFVKWFGRRDAETDDDEPARFEPPATASVQPLRRPASANSSVPAKGKPRKVGLNGFDPYNSGAFERRNTWERTNRR